MADMAVEETTKEVEKEGTRKHEAKIPFVDFLATRNTVYVNSQEHYDYIIRMLEKIGIMSKHIIASWKALTELSAFKGYICLEYDNEHGLGFYLNVEESKDWYGKEPIRMTQIVNGKY